MYRKIVIGLAAVGLGASVVACSGTGPGQSAASQQVAPGAIAVDSATQGLSSSTTSLRLLTEPGSGIGPIYKLITGAKHSVDLTMYELVDSTAEADLAADAARGVDVRVLLDRRLEKSSNTSAYNYLSAHRVHVRWAPAGTTYHQKTLTVDGGTSVIMTLNLVSRDYSGTRDFAVIDTNHADVAAIVSTFTMTADSEWDQAFTQLARAGAHVRLYRDSSSVLYIHAKAIVADAGRSGQRVLVGSQNFSVASLGYNRELGLITSNSSVVASISATLARDFAGAGAYSPPSGSSGSGAECTATASVYDASRDENNVYVHSNQDDQEATAQADGYSGSYKTDSSGYALIYLNGPAAGAKITVTVGGATCTTSD